MDDDYLRYEYKLVILGENECSICGRPLRTLRRTLTMAGTDLEEVDIITEHKGCKSTVDRIKKLKSKILDAEFELFLHKFKDRS